MQLLLHASKAGHDCDGAAVGRDIGSVVGTVRDGTTVGNKDGAAEEDSFVGLKVGSAVALMEPLRKERLINGGPMHSDRLVSHWDEQL